MKGEVVPRRVLPAFVLVLAASCTPASAQTGTPPLLDIIDFSGDNNVQPLVLVTGGQGASTLGIQVTSQANSTLSTTAPVWSTIMPPGYGGLSLLQTSTATSSGGVSSPTFAMCANQYGGTTGTAGPDCWWWQVQGGTSGVTNPPDIIQLFRVPSTNTTNNITVLFPAAINLATAPNTATSTAGQITVGPQPYIGANANVPSTFTGASTSATASATAGPVVIQPGQLTSGTPDNKSAEGALQVMQSYLGTNASGANIGLLACSDNSTPQGVVVCGTSTAAGQLVGVYDNNPSQLSTSPSVIPIRYGRALIKNSGSAALWTSGDYVCRDITNNGYVVDNGTTPCSRGTYVGVSAGDPTGIGNVNSHAVDLVQEPIVQGGGLMTFFCAGAVTASQDNYLFPGASTTSCGETSVTNYVQPVSFSGTLKNLEVFYGHGPGTGISDVFTVLHCTGISSCSSTSVSCSATGATGAPASCSDATDSVTVALGDGIQIVDKPGSGSGARDVRVTVLIQ